jgi:hypothetical protein
MELQPAYSCSWNGVFGHGIGGDGIKLGINLQQIAAVGIGERSREWIGTRIGGWIRE